jgi:catechol 2,3-dioxygenase-like lactoylglutathione lyase family enzyme
LSAAGTQGTETRGTFGDTPPVPRLRQAVFAVRDLERAVESLRSRLGLREPFADPDVAYFGLRNAVFTIGDTFLELVSPVQDDTAAGRQIDRQGGDCGYMAMLQVEDVGAARERARELGMREVFEVEFDDIAEAHLHPADIGGAIVSLSEPRPPSSWRWGGPDWEARSAPGAVSGLTLGVPDAAAVTERWQQVAGGPIPVSFVDDSSAPGIVAVEIDLGDRRVTLAPADLA